MPRVVILEHSFEYEADEMMALAHDYRTPFGLLSWKAARQYGTKTVQVLLAQSIKKGSTS
jgi:hypothetical protein